MIKYWTHYEWHIRRITSFSPHSFHHISNHIYIFSMYLFDSIHPCSLMFPTPPSLTPFIYYCCRNRRVLAYVSHSQKMLSAWSAVIFHRPSQLLSVFRTFCRGRRFVSLQRTFCLFRLNTMCLCVLWLTCWAVQTERWTWQEVARYRVVFLWWSSC